MREGGSQGLGDLAVASGEEVEVAELVGFEALVGQGDDLHPGAAGREDAVRGVFDDDAALARNTEAGGGSEEDERLRLRPCHLRVVPRDDDRNLGEPAVGLRLLAVELALGAGRDGHGDALLKQLSDEQLGAGHGGSREKQALEDELDARSVLVHRKRNGELAGDELRCRSLAAAHDSALEREIVHLSEGADDLLGGLGVKGLGVEEHAVEIEDYGAERRGKAGRNHGRNQHGGYITLRRGADDAGRCYGSRVRQVLGLLGLLAACSREPVPEGPVLTPSAAADEAQTRAPGVNPFGLEAEPLAAKAGDLAFVPSKATIDGAFERGAEEQPFVYLPSRLIEVGERQSRVRWSTGQRAYVSNALIIPVPRGQSANPGMIVLTSGASKTGLSRALVVPGGTPDSPAVRSLDWAEGLEPPEPVTLAPGTFNVLREPLEIGSSVACTREDRKEWRLVVKRAGARALGLGFAGMMRVIELDASCVAVPLVPALAVGSTVYVPKLGRFVAARVESVDSERGRVLARFEFAGASRRETFGYANLAPSL